MPGYSFEVGAIRFSCTDIFGGMSVKCKNICCKYCDNNNICYLFKIVIDEKGQCASFENKEEK
jgi:hypothetical protein